MNEVLCQKKGEIDILDWLVLAKHYTKNGEEEIAFQCYYMAHLQDHERFGTNNKLAFSTIDQAGVIWLNLTIKFNLKNEKINVVHELSRYRAAQLQT